jgi:hypothetical protein
MNRSRGVRLEALVVNGGSFGAFAALLALPLAIGSCHGNGSPGGGEAEARDVLTTLRARPASPIGQGLAESFEPVRGGLRPKFGAAATSAGVVLPERATAATHVEDAATGTSVEISLRGARDVVGRSSGGYLVYPAAHDSGATVLHRASPVGTEDFLSFEARPAAATVAYDVALGERVRGLRLVSNTLELLDEHGAPRLRVSPPYLVGADGAQTDATLAVEGCAVDTNAAAPWGRSVKDPGARTCTVRVSWNDQAVSYPAVLDPRWTTTGSMTTARQGHTATLLSTGKVLVVGGSSGTSALATAELYDRTTGTWAATGSMTGARQLHSATQLNTSSNSTTSGKVLVAGGLNGTTSQNTAQLYSVSAGTWTAAANLNAARHAHTATLLADGRVLVVGGLNGTTTLQTAALYDPSSGTGTWTATIGPIPPPGLKNHTATLLVTSNNQLNNKVLLVGGNSGTATLASVFLFDPAQSAFSTLASIPSPREGHTATVLANGKLLVTGGKNGSTALATAIVFDPSTGPGSWSSAGTMTAARFGHTATLLSATISSGGQVLVAGGSSGSTSLSSAELFSGTSTWTATSAMPAPAQGHTATLLGNGAVLIAGGVNGTTTLSAARLYDASLGLGCTSDGQCTSGFCVSGVCCDTACTNTCMACNLSGSVGICTAKTNGTSCNDGNACTQTDTCQSGTCTGTNPVVCHASDACHVAGVCATSTGVCSNPNAANGTTCNDGNACTQTDTCQSGTCTGTNPVVCHASDACHVAGVCATSTGVCSNPNAANGTSCSDGNACTQTDTCQSGTCVGSNPVTCPPPAQCHAAGVCDPASGTCSNPNATDGTACIDGLICTQTDTCQGGTCVGSNPIVCQPLDACHVAGVCLEPIGCTNPAAPDGTTCNDGNACTQADRCLSGSCAGALVNCPQPDQCHLAGSCDPVSGACTNQAVADGTGCDDGNPCTSNDACTAGVCKPGPLVTCPPSDQCHGAGVCIPALGTCSNPTLADSTPCDDGNPCTMADSCSAGVCVSGPPVTCDAVDDCHLPGTCDGNTGVCSSPPNPSCTTAPVITAQPQGSPGVLPREIVGFDPTTGTLTVTPSDNVGAPQPAPSTTLTITALVGNAMGCVADLNHDGTMDILFENPTTGVVQYLPRLDAQAVSYGPLFAIDNAAPAGTPGPAACGDLDGDGNVDVVLSFATPDNLGATTPSLMVYRSFQSGGLFQRIEVPTGFPSGVVVGGPALADFDGDGKPDLAVYAANNQPLLDSQLFVFPNGGMPEDTTSGTFALPFSSATRVSVPGTDPLASPQTANWGALTTIDGDSDGHPDIWALGTRGIVYLFRSLGGFQFAAPEFNGVISNVGSRFSIDHLDADGDGISDLLLGSLDMTPRIFPGAGGGTLKLSTAAILGRPTVGTLLTPKKAMLLAFTPPPDQGQIGLVKANPVATTYPDDRGVLHPSIFMRSITGHLVERVQQVQIQTALEPVQISISVPTGMGTGETIVVTVQERVETGRTNVWTWLDHGLPNAVGSDNLPIGATGVFHQTLVDSNPAIAVENFGGSPMMRRIFVRGLDGHLWELDQQSGNEQWVDDGLPVILQNGKNSAVYSLVGDPSAVPDFIDTAPLTKVFILDTAGRLDYFWPRIDGAHWATVGGIGGGNNCFTQSGGNLGDGSPKAISFVGHDGNRHQEVFVVDNIGELLSWRDGSWEEQLDAQYIIQPGVILPDSLRQEYDGAGQDNLLTSVKICWSGSARQGITCTCPGTTVTDLGCCPDIDDPASLPPFNGDGNTFEDYQYSPFPQTRFESHGTPDVAVWNNGSTLMRAVYVRNSSGPGSLNEFLITGDTAFPASKATPPTVDISFPATQKVGNDVVFSGQHAKLNTVGTPFCALAVDKLVQDTLISDPVVVQDTTFGEISVLTTSINHWLTIAHRAANSAVWQTERRPMSDISQPDYTNAIAGSPSAVPAIGGATPGLDIFAIRSTGILTEANSAAGSSTWRSCEVIASDQGNQTAAQKNCPAQLTCSSSATFQWLLDAANSHATDNAPAILDNSDAFHLNAVGDTNIGRQCQQDTILNTIVPQWVSPQRFNQKYRPTEYNTIVDASGNVSSEGDPPFAKGYDDEVSVEVEGVVLDSHIAAVDTPIDHSHGSSHDDWPIVHHDWNVIIAPDPKYQNLMTDSNILEGGKMELEWEMADHIGCTQYFNFPLVGPLCVARGLVPGDPQTTGFTDADVPAIGDRVAVRGRFIFDCGHPPYRAEIHPIDAIAVIHQGSDVVKYRTSPHGGTTWYQPGDVNLPSGAETPIQTNLADIVTKITAKPNVSGWGPFDDLIADVDQITGIINDASFVYNGCTRHYNPDLIGPATDSTQTATSSLYYPYEHAMNDLFSASIYSPTTTTPFPGPNQFPLALPIDPNFTFVIPGQTDPVSPPLPETPMQSENLFNSTATPRHFRVCFNRTVTPGMSHDNAHPDAALWEGLTCDSDDSQELVTYITAQDQTKIYVDNAANCLDLKLYPGTTLAIGSHGYECDFSCGERWDDDFSASADDRIGFTRLSFTADQNFGAEGTGYPGSYTVRSQPDLTTRRSRSGTAGDYSMTIQIVDSDAPGTL